MDQNIVGVLIYQIGEGAGPLEQESRGRIERLYPGLPVFTNDDTGPRGLGGSQHECVKATLDQCAKSGDDSIAFFLGHHPLLDAALTKEAQAEHFRFFSQYSYGENIPPGLIPDFVSKDFLSAVASPVEGNLREFVARNLERLDVGLFFRLPDLRQYRLDFTTSTPRAARLAADCLKAKPDLTFARMEAFIRANPHVIRPVPSYFEIELTTRTPAKPTFWPAVRRTTDVDLDPALAEKLNRDIASTSWPNDATVALGGLGDPLLHPQFLSVAQAFLENANVTRLYVETFGVDLSAELVKKLEELPNARNLHVIVRLSTLDRMRYRQLYGTDLFSEVMANLERLEQSPPPFSLYAEMIRMTDVEDEIGAYHDRFEKTPIKILIQKFNRYIDKLPERRVSDLTPLHRDFCWHLARDMYLTADGKLALCRQEPRADRSGLAMDFAEVDIAGFLKVTMKYHNASVTGDLKVIPMPCGSCDEWYTFNG